MKSIGEKLILGAPYHTSTIGHAGHGTPGVKVYRLAWRAFFPIDRILIGHGGTDLFGPILTTIRTEIK